VIKSTKMRRRKGNRRKDEEENADGKRKLK
jgi:hypothetical protein